MLTLAEEDLVRFSLMGLSHHYFLHTDKTGV